MATPHSTCSSVVHDLQILRDVIGQSDGDRDKLLLQLEQACHIVAKFKAHLRELGAESEAAIANLMAALEERTIISQGQGSLKELPSTMQPVLDNMRLYINESMKEFSEAQLQICQICAEIADNGLSIDSTSRQVNEPDLALSKMVELESHLRKDQREKLQNLGSRLMELSELMNGLIETQREHFYFTSLISSNVDQVSGLGSLTPEVSEQAELEVERLNALKASKMKELFLKMQSELEEIYRGAHMDVDSDAAKQILIGLIESGNADMSDLLSSMDDQIAKAKEQVLSRKNVLALVEKWKYAAEEEKWLDDYEKDENRYKARGAHKNLEHAEKARIRVSKIPSIVETLTSRVKAWELEKGIPFLYDKDPLLPTLEEYAIRRQEREDEKRRYRVCLNPSTEHRSVDRVPTPCGHGVAWS